MQYGNGNMIAGECCITGFARPRFETQSPTVIYQYHILGLLGVADVRGEPNRAIHGFRSMDISEVIKYRMRAKRFAEDHPFVRTRGFIVRPVLSTSRLH